MSELMTLKEVAAMLKVTTKTLYKLRGQGQIAFTKIGGATRISLDELERFLATNRDTMDAAQASQATEG